MVVPEHDHRAVPEGIRVLPTRVLRLVVDYNVGLGTIMVELAAGPPPEGPLIVFQTRLGPPGQQDIELGMTGYSLSDERGATVYDGLVRCELRADSLELELSDVAVGLGFDREIAFSLDPEQGFAEVLAPLLQRIINRQQPPEASEAPAR